MGNLDYRGLAVLDAVASTGSFDKAALLLGISQSAVSQRIKALEDATGRLLVVRGTPSVPSGLGQRLVVHFRHVKLMEAALDIDLGQTVSMPAIAIAVDADSLASWFPQALAPLLSPPRCQLEVQQAASEQAQLLVREGAVFGAVVAGAPAESPNGTTLSALGTLRYVCVATPVFAGHWFGDGFAREAVALAPAVVSEAALMARFLDEQLGLRGAFPHHTLPVSPALHASIYSGLAYGLLPEPIARVPLAAGTLVDLCPGRALAQALHWQAWNIDTPFTRALSEQIVQTARRTLHLAQPDA